MAPPAPVAVDHRFMARSLHKHRFRPPRRTWRKGALLGALALLCGGLLSSGVAIVVEGEQSDRAEGSLNRWMVGAVGSLTAEAARYADALRGAAAGLGVPATLDQADFYAVTAPLIGMR